jgi:hypothetical protein
VIPDADAKSITPEVELAYSQVDCSKSYILETVFACPLVTQILIPSNATPLRQLPTGNVPRTAPVAARSLPHGHIRTVFPAANNRRGTPKTLADARGGPF